jgi:hypothetical protein
LRILADSRLTRFLHNLSPRARTQHRGHRAVARGGRHGRGFVFAHAELGRVDSSARFIQPDRACFVRAVDAVVGVFDMVGE